MSVKILASSIIGIEQFCEAPLTALDNAVKGTLAVCENNKPVMYAVSSARLSELLTAEAQCKRQAAIALDAQFFDEPDMPVSAPSGKFALYSEWQPDPDFLRQAALWGIALHEPVTSEELAAFIAYWQAEGRVFHQVQWQQKLARHLQVSRRSPTTSVRRDVTQVAEPDNQIPSGFRGK